MHPSESALGRRSRPWPAGAHTLPPSPRPPRRWAGRRWSWPREGGGCVPLLLLGGAGRCPAPRCGALPYPTAPNINLYFHPRTGRHTGQRTFPPGAPNLGTLPNPYRAYLAVPYPAVSCISQRNATYRNVSYRTDIYPTVRNVSYRNVPYRTLTYRNTTQHNAT